MKNFEPLVIDTNEILNLNNNLSISSSYFGLNGNGNPQYINSARIPQAPRNCSFDWTSRLMCGTNDPFEPGTMRMPWPFDSTKRRGIC
ncbi:MAG: hypothetical protein U0V49_01985 [Saprospiraceae bacterium]